MSTGASFNQLRHKFVDAINEENLSGEDTRSAISAFDRARGDVLGDLLDGTNGNGAEAPKKPRKARGPNKKKADADGEGNPT